ncbi:MAG: hypothetical protein L0221_02500 [Chloroflexi bacterium]|nr:hypothetical protein [Chloroflexota bacterium]
MSEIEVALGTLAVVLPLVLVIAAPMPSTPMGYRQPFWLVPLELISYGVLVLGYLWMMKIRYTGPEDGAGSNWRSH